MWKKKKILHSDAGRNGAVSISLKSLLRSISGPYSYPPNLLTKFFFDVSGSTLVCLSRCGLVIRKSTVSCSRAAVNGLPLRKQNAAVSTSAAGRVRHEAAKAWRVSRSGVTKVRETDLQPCHQQSGFKSQLETWWIKLEWMKNAKILDHVF